MTNDSTLSDRALPGPLAPRVRRRVAWGRSVRDGGSVSVEMAVLVLPLAAVMAIFAVFCARLAGTELDLNATASAAARAASLAQAPDGAQPAAAQAAAANLAGHGRTCNPLQVTVDTSGFHRGGRVAVTITCSMSTSDLMGLGLPGTLTSSSTAQAVIDTWRPVAFGPPSRDTR
jgi:hypothetical protein